jgi:hypothetical protein
MGRERLEEEEEEAAWKRQCQTCTLLLLSLSPAWLRAIKH